MLNRSLIQLLAIAGMISAFTSLLPAGESWELLESGRRHFYRGVADEGEVRKALEIFRRLAETDTALTGRALTYVGASKALLGKHARWPHRKYQHVIEGLDLMREGVEESPEDMEALFIYASTCYYLPFFFNVRNEVDEMFDRIIDLSHREHQAYPDSLVQNALSFIRENGDPGPTQVRRIEQVEAGLHRP